MTGRNMHFAHTWANIKKYQTSYYTKAQKEISSLRDFQFCLETVNYVCTIIF